MIRNFINMDTCETEYYVNDLSNASSLQYNGNSSPDSAIYSTLSSPAPASAGKNELNEVLSNLRLPSADSPQPNTYLHTNAQVHSNIYDQENNAHAFSPINECFIKVQQPYSIQQSGISTILKQNMLSTQNTKMQDRKNEYGASLCILEHPVDKFRFRYKSEMHGTHGSLHGANSKRTPKTYPEVELRNFKGRAIIRCSLFQTNLESPHSHQLVVRKDDIDFCDPHDLEVSESKGYVAQFQNMGIIHTAKKFIFKELLEKKRSRLCFELKRDELTTKECQQLEEETTKEAKNMNLNQVRLCFEAFEINSRVRIAAPVYTNPINNRKSAQTGELKIVRLSIATGSVSGGDDLILLVEKVSKKNIKVRFFEENEDGEPVWEAFASFRESDVHHQYAITCRTPPYKDKDIENPKEVNIELVRPSDDERSFSSVSFRYKPLNAIISRKRRRTTYLSATNSSSSATSMNSIELPTPVQEQQMWPNGDLPTISSEFNKIEMLSEICNMHSEEIDDLCAKNYGILFNGNEFDGNESTSTVKFERQTTKTMKTNEIDTNKNNRNLNRILEIYEIYNNCCKTKAFDKLQSTNLSKEIQHIYAEHAESNINGDSIVHEIILSDNSKAANKMFKLLLYFKQQALLNRVLNANNESALHYACLHDRAQYIRSLLGLGCDPNIQDRDGNTAVHVAVREQNRNCVESFLKFEHVKPNLSLRNDEGETPLHLAIRLRSYEIARILLQLDPSAALKTNSKEGNTALHMAIDQQSMKLVQLTLSAMSNKDVIVATRNIAGQTPLDLAKNINTPSANEIVRLLTLITLNSRDDEPGNLVIKEEQASSSCSDEEDTHVIVKNMAVVIKKENYYSPDYNCDQEIDVEMPEKSLRLILSNEEKFLKIAKLLNKNKKWHELAERSKLQSSLCLWSDAEDMLGYVRNNPTFVKYDLFEAALAEVEPEALKILLK